MTSEAEHEPATKGQLKAIIQLVADMRQSEKQNRKATEKRLEELEEQLIQLQVEVKSGKASKK